MPSRKGPRESLCLTAIKTYETLSQDLEDLPTITLCARTRQARSKNRKEGEKGLDCGMSIRPAEQSRTDLPRQALRTAFFQACTTFLAAAETSGT